MPALSVWTGFQETKPNFEEPTTQSHPKTGIDIACWDILGKVAGYRQQGYTRFQLRVGGNPDVDIERIHAVRAVLAPTDRLVADANTGWTRKCII